MKPASLDSVVPPCAHPAHRCHGAPMRALRRAACAGLLLICSLPRLAAQSSGTTVTTDLSVPNNGTYTFAGLTTVSGAKVTLGTSASLTWGGGGTLAGSTVAMGIGSSMILAPSTTLNVDSATSASGALTFKDNNQGATFVNAGTLTTQYGAGIIVQTFDNQGTLSVSGDSVYPIGASGITSTFQNSGTVNIDRSFVNIYSALKNTGTLSTSDNGLIFLYGPETTADLGSMSITSPAGIILAGPLDNSNATLTAPAGGSFNVEKATISGGTISSGAITIGAGDSVTLSDATYSGDLSLGVNGSALFKGSSDFTGNNLTLALGANLTWDHPVTLTGRNITMGSGSFLIANGSMTIAANTTLTGYVSLNTKGSGSTLVNDGHILSINGGTIAPPAFTNEGTITVQGAGGLMLGSMYGGGTVVNDSSGQIVVDGGEVDLGGDVSNLGKIYTTSKGGTIMLQTNKTSDFGSIDITAGGTIAIASIIDNTGLTLNPPIGGKYLLQGGSIKNGSVAAGALGYSGANSMLDGVTVNDDCTLSSNAQLTLVDGSSFSGTNITLGQYSQLYWLQAGQLTGQTIAMGPSSTFTVGRYYGVGGSLTLDPNTTLSGMVNFYSNSDSTITNNGTINQTSGTGIIYGYPFTNNGTVEVTSGTLNIGSDHVIGSVPPASSFVNNGTLIASGGTLSIGNGFSGTGSLQAQGSGTIVLNGSLTTACLSHVSLDSTSHIRIAGTLDNSNATLQAPSGGAFELYGGTIRGGIIGPGAISYFPQGGTLDGVNFGGAINVPEGAAVTLTDGVNVSNQSITLGASSSLTFNQALPYLTSNTVTLGQGSQLTVTMGSLTIDSKSTLIGNGQVILSDPTAVFTNYGHLGNLNSSLTISASNVVNSGQITVADNNSISANCPISLGGTVNLEGGTISSTKGITIFSTVFSDGGTLTAGSGVTIDQNAYFEGDGTINGDLILSGGTLNVGSMGGSLVISNGSLNIASPSILQFSTFGSYAAPLYFDQPTGDIDIGQGRLTLSLMLKAVPQAGLSTKIISATAGTHFAGTFANIPSSGSQITAAYNGSSYTFRVDYDTTGVTLSVVNSPSSSTPSAPSITTQPENVTVNLGSSATFSIAAAGNPQPTYQWQKSGVNIPGATGSSYTIPVVSLSDSGTYDVVVTNSQGSVTSASAGLFVNATYAPPSISHQPSKVNTSVGGSASFSVSASGNPSPAYQWRKDGVAIPGATSSSYTLTNISASEAGTYDVVVSNSQGSVTSSGAALTVTASNSAPTVTQQPNSATVTTGNSVTFSVTASGNPTPTYQWRKNGIAIANATDATFSIDSVSSADAGTYDVVVSNANGSTTSSGATLTVTSANSAPTITEQPENTRALVGSTASFSVSATGNPAPAYQWRKDGVAIPGGTSATLALTNVQSSDVGSYDVVVTNSIGSVTSRLVRLDVTPSAEPPTILTQPISLSVIVGQQATFSVEAEADPTPAYQWTKNGNVIAGATDTTLTIPAAQLSDAGTYSVSVSNSSGSVTSQNASLKVYANDYAGTYFGTLGSGGQFALIVNHDHTGSYLAYLGDGKTAIVQASVLIDDSGHFSFQTSTPAVATSSVSAGRLQAAATSSSLTVDGTIVGNGSLTGSITGGVSLTLSGTEVSSGSTGSMAGFYQTASSATNDSVNLIVSGDGQVFVLTQTSTGVSAATGTVDSTGKVSATTSNGQTITATVAAGSGTAKVTLADASGSTTLAGGTPDMLESQHLVGISARALCDTGSNNAVAGFIITGNESKQVLIRAVGPGLAGQGITQPIPNPKLDLYAGQTLIASNTGWGSAANADEIAAAASRIGDFALAQGSADSAIYTTLQPGLYTANASPSDGKAGVVLVEVYDLSTPTLGNKIVALSSRVEVGTGQDEGVAGFVVSGSVPKQFLIRAVGPTLASLGVSGVLAHPVLKLYQGSTVIAQNSGWTTAANATQIPTVSQSIGEFALQSNDDAALLVTLDPGVYTANVSSGDGTKGVALIEVYEIR